MPRGGRDLVLRAGREANPADRNKIALVGGTEEELLHAVTGRYRDR
jgi:hypothetical protein